MHTALTDYLLEIVQNAVESGAGVIDLGVTEDSSGMTFQVTDNGCGMNAEKLARCRDPYFTGEGKHPGRTVGLGLALLDQVLTATDGRLEVDSAPGRGTRVTAWCNGRHIDTPPVGALDDFFLTALCFDGDYELRIDRRRTPADGGIPRRYRLSRSEVREALGDVAVIANQMAVRDFLRCKEEEIRSCND